MVAGSSSSVKLYHKGPEFESHDRVRVRSHTDVDALQLRANMLLRCEVELHARTLDEEHGNPPGPAEISMSWVKDVYDRDVARLVRDGIGAMRQVRTHTAVRGRLYARYTAAQASALWGTWLELSALGEDFTRARLARATFYKHRQKLTAAGCSWHGGDVKLDTSVRLVPEDFSPVRSDPRRLTDEAPEVASLLAPYRVAS
jgi:hypothetical protein